MDAVQLETKCIDAVGRRENQFVFAWELNALKFAVLAKPALSGSRKNYP